eukprot:m.128910 g.128910  ORF g.128910 m.128910 type:complete len:291 (-) comp9761_c0_seq3:2649-3521(-)
MISPQRTTASTSPTGSWALSFAFTCCSAALLSLSSSAPRAYCGDRATCAHDATRSCHPNFIFVVRLSLISLHRLTNGTFCRSHSIQRRLVAGVNVVFAALEAVSWTAAITEGGKRWIAEPRPDFVERCIGSTNFNGERFDSNGNLICDGEKAVVAEGRLSFPSGHSSLSLCIGLFCTLYFVWSLYVRPANTYFRHPVYGWRSVRRRWMASFLFVACIHPLVVAFWVAASRVVDHRHSPADICGGAIIGITIAAVLFVRLISEIYPRPAFKYHRPRPLSPHSSAPMRNLEE